MKLYGYVAMGLPVEQIAPALLAEVTFCATPVELRRVAEFFSFCATEMERMGESYDHMHLSDRIKDFQNSPHVVVAKFD